jgi:hypothetical protein
LTTMYAKTRLRRRLLSEEKREMIEMRVIVRLMVTCI